MGRMRRGTLTARLVEAWNPSDKSAQVTLSNANLTALSDAVNTDRSGRAFFGSGASGRYYFEFTVDSIGAGDGGCGLADASWGFASYVGSDLHGYCAYTTDDNYNGLHQSAGTFAVGARVSVAYDAAGKRVFTRVTGGAWRQSGDPVASTGGVSLSGFAGLVFPAFDVRDGAQVTAFFSPASWSFAAPAGYLWWP